MALPASKQSVGLLVRIVLPVSAMSAMFVMLVTAGCTGKNSSESGADKAARVYGAALSDDTSARGLIHSDRTPAAYWVVDRIEEGIAVLENLETLSAMERPADSLPDGVEEGTVLKEGGGALRIDEEETAAWAARIMERFGQLKVKGE